MDKYITDLSDLYDICGVIEIPSKNLLNAAEIRQFQEAYSYKRIMLQIINAAQSGQSQLETTTHLSAELRQDLEAKGFSIFDDLRMVRRLPTSDPVTVTVISWCLSPYLAEMDKDALQAIDKLMAQQSP